MNKLKVHLIGIGGIGTSALARWFLSQRYKVSGSDTTASPIIQQLKKEGIRVVIGHKPENLKKETNLVVYSAAVPLDNPEIKKAKKSGIPIKSYSQAIGDLTKKYKTIAIAGAHGKSTSTALLSLVLIKAGFNPTVIVGTKLNEFKDSNFRKGKSNYLILEADEYHQSFLTYSPLAVIITNIDREHLDFYKNLSAIKNAFLKFIGNIQPGGILVLNKDDKNLFSLKNKIKKISEKNKLKLNWYTAKSIYKKNYKYKRIKNILKIPGEHNISNATAVYVLAKALGVKEKAILRALNQYRGAWRRMERRGKLRIKNEELRIPVYDDYAHHPTEIKATLLAFRQKFSQSKIICVFQPHQNQRLKILFKEFISAFNDADILILLPVHRVIGRDKINKKYTAEKLASIIKKRNSKIQVFYLKNPKKLKDLIRKILFSKFYFLNSSIIVMMGAGDIYKMTKNLIEY